MKPQVDRVYIVGCGGVGSWLTASLSKLMDPCDITLIDGDVLEDKNLDRQLFKREDVGRNKAKALGELYGTNYIEKWFIRDLIGTDLHFNPGPDDLLFLCVDNNPTRHAALQMSEDCMFDIICASNETTSAEAWYFRYEWVGTYRDPLFYYEEISRDRTGDPRGQAIGCTGEAQVANRQLVSANFMAAALAQHLFVLWKMEVPKIDDEKIINIMPYKLVANLSQLETFRGLNVELVEQQQTTPTTEAERTENE